ncbi:MAG: hypothetical protein ACD_61C00186G0011 [uncultured bacterium]|nr:MAG: hypothetical protein ACD_61C00186G0011 [uncultured bacterium]
MIKRISRFISANKGSVLIFLILMIGIIFRFWHYFDRLNFSVDQGRDALIGLEAIRLHTLPLLGPPSSSWGFNFGPLYYYVIILFTQLLPSIYSPWIGFTILSVLSVFLAFKIGTFTRNSRFGIILAFVTAASFGEIVNSTNLLNTSLVSFAVFLSFFGVSSYLKTQKYPYLLLAGFAISMAFQSHLQSVPLLFLLISPFFLNKKKKYLSKIKSVLLALSGFVLGMLPMIVFEIQHNLAWTKSIIDYATFGQYRFYTPVRWLTDITVFWPERFGGVLWSIPKTGIFVVVIAFLVIVYHLYKKNIDKISLFALAIFLLEIFSIRNYRGPRSPEYLIFTQFFIIYIFSLTVALLVEKKNRLLTFVAVILILLFGLFSYLPLIGNKSNSGETIRLLTFVKKELNPPVTLYVFANSYENAYSLQYLLTRAGLTAPDGYRLGLCDNGDTDEKTPPRCPDNFIYSAGRFVLYDLQNSFEDFTRYDPQTIDPLKLYLRTYNNYELIKY